MRSGDLDFDCRGQITGGYGIHVGQHQVFGQVAPVSLLVLLAHDGESVRDIGRVVAGNAVELEEQRIEPRDAVATVIFVPLERPAVVTEVAGEGFGVMRGIGQPQYFAADKVGDFLFLDFGCVLLGEYVCLIALTNLSSSVSVMAFQTGASRMPMVRKLCVNSWPITMDVSRWPG